MNLSGRLATLKNGLQDAMAYRLEFVFEVITSACVPAMIQCLLWYSLFQVGKAEKIAAMTYTQMLHYTFTSLLFSQIRGGNYDFQLQEMIRTGQLSNYLLKPMGIVEFTYLRGIGIKLAITFCCFLVGFLFSQTLGISPERLAGAMLLALIGNIIHYQIGATLAATAFFWEEAVHLLMVKNMIVGLLSGELIPLTLFPPHLQWIWKSTPFYLYVFGPTQYALGQWTTTTYYHNLGLSLVWLLGCTGLVHLTWKVGLKRYTSAGN